MLTVTFSPHSKDVPAPYVEIIEQPASHSLRFRYKSETKERTTGSIVGVHTTAEVKTYPEIKVNNYQGTYIVVVSCVTKDGPPYKPHPHNLVDKENCKDGICKIIVNNPQMTCSFENLGIQCVKKKEFAESLKIRENLQIDPFATGFKKSSSIDQNVVRLCFQVFIRSHDNCSYLPLQPVVSDPIYDRKIISDLAILKLSHHSAPVTGGTQVILLCDRVAKDDIEIWFYEKQASEIVWECQAKFRPCDVHRQVAICFKTPRYYNENIQHDVNVFVQLRKRKQNKRGEPRPFIFLSKENVPAPVADSSNLSYLPPVLASCDHNQAPIISPVITPPSSSANQQIELCPAETMSTETDYIDEEMLSGHMENLQLSLQLSSSLFDSK